MPVKEALQLIWALVVVVAVLAMAYLFTRFVTGRIAGGSSPGLLSKGRPLKLLAQLPVGRDQRVLLVQLGEQCYLLGAAQGEISMLDKLSSEEAESVRKLTESTEAGERMGFQEALKKVMEQRNRQRRS